MGGGVAPPLPLVVGPGHDLAADHRHRPDRHVAVLDRGPRLVEGQGHGLVVGHAANLSGSDHRVPTIGEGDDPGALGTPGSSSPRWRREWDLNPRGVAPHTLSRRADSAALAPLPSANQGIVTGAVRSAAPRSGWVLRNGTP